MTSGTLAYSVDQQRAWQGSLNRVGAAALLMGVAVFGGLIATGALEPAVIVCAASIVVLGPGVFWRRPFIAFCITLFCALFLEQFGIAGLDPITTETHFFQSLSGFTPLPVPVMPADGVLLPAVLAIVLPALARTRRFYRGALFGPVMLLVGAVITALLWGAVHSSAGTSFNPNAAWAEARSFLQLAAAYIVACNVISSRREVVQTMWVVIVAVGIKGIQGIQNYVIERQQGVSLEAITGHEDVIFFGAFFLLLAALQVYGGNKRQRTFMLWLLPAVAFTELVTSRRIAFIILAVGFIILGLSLWQAKKQLFIKMLPATLIIFSLYTIAFWDHSEGVLGQPIRAFKSQIGFTSERDRLSDQWRVIENQNITLNIKANPLIGIGFGRPYTFYVAEPSLDATGFVYWTYITHDAIMWVWMTMGLYGFIAFWYLVGSAIVYGLITLKHLTDGYLRAIAITVVAVVTMQVFFSYGDLGLTYSRSMIFIGCMLGLLVRLRDVEACATREQPGGTL